MNNIYNLIYNIYVDINKTYSHHFQLNDSIEGLQKDSSCHKSKEHLNTSLRTLELVQPTEIQTLMDTIISVSIFLIRNKSELLI